MKKTVVIHIMVDDVELAELEEVIAYIEKGLEKYENKRIDVRMQDNPLVVRR